MYATKLVEKEIDVNGLTYSIDLEAIALFKEEIECIQANVQTVYNKEGDVVTNRETIRSIERNIEVEPLSIEFSYEDFH